jgi:hypothetical protein
MDVIEGGNDPLAHMHRRMNPTCDLCGKPFAGRMPNPYWLCPSRGYDEQGHHKPEGAYVRIYLCREHRDAFDEAIRRAWTRERNRLMKGQRFIAGMAGVRPVNPLPSD